jgi:anti-sigma regulatory factor (Ser/Thr protein kinase)
MRSGSVRSRVPLPRRQQLSPVSVTALPVTRAFRAHPSALSQVRGFVRDQATADGLDGETVDDLVLAISEACVNAVIHTSSARVQLSWQKREGHVEIAVRDEGVFERKVPIPEFDGTAGRGIPIMLALVDEVTIREGTLSHPGTVVRFVKHLPANREAV